MDSIMQTTAISSYKTTKHMQVQTDIAVIGVFSSEVVIQKRYI